MGLQDFTYRLKAESGDTTPHDETTNSADLTGGTISLVSAGGGYAWQITGGKASAGTTARTINISAAGGGVTLAVRMAVTGYAGGFEYLAGWCVDTTPSRGLVLGQAGANNTRDRYVASTNATGNSITVNADFRTYVLRLTAPDSCVVKKWINTIGRSGTAADNTSGAVNVIINDVLDTVFAGVSGATVQISDLVLWPEELPDAYCAAIADDLRGTLDASSGANITGNLGTATASGIAAAILASVTIACSMGGATASGNPATISTGSNVTIACTVGTATASGHSAIVTSSGSATITTDVFKNNTGTVLASTSIPKLAAIKLSDMTLAASWTNQTTNGSGVLSLTGAMTAATDYLLVVSSSDGASVGVKKYTAT